MSILTQDDLAFWNKNGYIVVKNLIPEALLQNVVDATWSFLEMSPEDHSGWYDWPSWHKPRSGMVQMFHDQTMWDIRQLPQVHQVFATLYGTEKLWVSLDRLNMNPPALAQDDWQGVIHWDVDPTEYPSSLRMGGVLCLTDTAEDQGGFQCVPGTHLTVPEIVEKSTNPDNIRTPVIEESQIKPIPGGAGDLIVWNNWLLHSNSRNRTTKPRLAQYITMAPVDYHEKEERDLRITSWQKNSEPYNPNSYGSDSRRLEMRKSSPAELTELGKKLLGLDPW